MNSLNFKIKQDVFFICFLSVRSLIYSEKMKSWLENNLFSFAINFKNSTLGFIPKYLAYACLTTKVVKIDVFHFGCNVSSSATPSHSSLSSVFLLLISRAATGNRASLPSFPISLLPCCYLSSFLFHDRTSAHRTALAFLILATDAGRVSYTHTHTSLVTQLLSWPVQFRFPS